MWKPKDADDWLFVAALVVVPGPAVVAFVYVLAHGLGLI